MDFIFQVGQAKKLQKSGVYWCLNSQFQHYVTDSFVTKSQIPVWKKASDAVLNVMKTVNITKLLLLCDPDYFSKVQKQNLLFGHFVLLITKSPDKWGFALNATF